MTEKNKQPGQKPSLSAGSGKLEIRNDLTHSYRDLFSPEVIAALNEMVRFNQPQKRLMEERMERRQDRAKTHEKIEFLDPGSVIPGTTTKVEDARAGKFEGSPIPEDLKRQWVQGTGPAAKPNATLERSLRNVAYALLSGADGWMFDGEDALGQITSMSLDNQRNLKLALARDPIFLKVSEAVSVLMNDWARTALGKPIIEDWEKQLDFTTVLFRPRGLHLDDRHMRDPEGEAVSASIVDTTLYVVNNVQTLRERGASLVLYLPKIQTAGEAAFWNEMLTALEEHLGLPEGTIKVYVLVEQVEATFQLMEIRAALGKHFVGYNTGRWDYINSVSDAVAWDPAFINPNIESITMTYGYMRNYEDRVRRAVNTPDQNGNCALWQGGMEPNIPVGSEAGVKSSMEKALAGARREREEGASGKWVAHWKMVHLIRPVWEEAGQDNQLGRDFPALTYTPDDAAGLFLLEEAPRTIRGARNLISVALQYGNAFCQGLQAAALKPADFFGNDDILYLMEDMATGEIRLSILWEWIHKGALLTEEDPETGIQKGDTFNVDLFERLLAEEYEKLQKAEDKDVFEVSKITTLPIVHEIVEAYVLSATKVPWYIDLLNINLNNQDIETARERIRLYLDRFLHENRRITENIDFAPITSRPEAIEAEAAEWDEEIKKIEDWFRHPRFKEITRLYSARQVAEQQGTITRDYSIAKQAATGFYKRLRELFHNRDQVTTFGPYSPGQAVTMKRIGIEGIYLGGWATSAKGSITEDPGPDLASYPLSQVPDEASSIVRALLTADKNQRYQRSRMSEHERLNAPRYDYRPFIIADADTGHGGDPHVRNLIRRFVEVGVPGYHIEDQKPGCKKCGHQGGKVLVPQDEQNKRLNAARFQLDIMGVPGLIVARTDAEAATLLDGSGDERDHPFILGATNTDLPPYRQAILTVLKRFYEQGATEINGHLLYRVSTEEFQSAYAWLHQTGLLDEIDEAAATIVNGGDVEKTLEAAMSSFYQRWESEAGLKTYGEAVADAMVFHQEDGVNFDLSKEEWLAFAATASLPKAKAKARELGLTVIWDWELARTPEGYYQIRGGIDFAISRSLHAAPFADLLWMETKTANLTEAKRFADAIHAVFPEKMLAYNLSPSFNWDTTGMSDDEMRNYPMELGKLGYVFNFITYGGHQIDGLAAENFSTALKEDGMLALARLQRRFRLLNSPYKTPQTLAGGPRADGALVACTGRTATTKAMGKGSTQFQHLVQTEVPPKVLESWIEEWTGHYQVHGPLSVDLRPHLAGSELLELDVLDEGRTKVANVVFGPITDRKGNSFLSVRDANTFKKDFRHKRLMALMHVFLVHRYKANSLHFVSPTEDCVKQAESMLNLGIYETLNKEIGSIMVATVDKEMIAQITKPDSEVLNHLITKEALVQK